MELSSNEWLPHMAIEKNQNPGGRFGATVKLVFKELFGHHKKVLGANKPFYLLKSIAT